MMACSGIRYVAEKLAKLLWQCCQASSEFTETAGFHHRIVAGLTKRRKRNDCATGNFNTERYLDTQNELIKQRKVELNCDTDK